jgi:hypothetical protein
MPWPLWVSALEMSTLRPRFSARRLAAFTDAQILGVRSGTEHRYTSVWVVAVDDRVFVRSWNGKPTGWYRAFLTEPRGSVSLGNTEIRVRGAPVRSARIRRAVSEAYAEKYPTKGSVKWVRGFREPAREANTLEILPR